MDVRTTDLCDAHESLTVVTPLLLRRYGGRQRLGGRIATLRVWEDNSLVRATLETPGDGRILVVDGGGSLRCALVGDLLAQLAIDNGWGGILVHGCIRDSRVIDQMDVCIHAMGTHPRRSVKKGVGEADVEVSFGGTVFTPGHYVYADEDGIVVSREALDEVT